MSQGGQNSMRMTASSSAMGTAGSGTLGTETDAIKVDRPTIAGHDGGIDGAIPPDLVGDVGDDTVDVLNFRSSLNLLYGVAIAAPEPPPAVEREEGVRASLTASKNRSGARTLLSPMRRHKRKARDQVGPLLIADCGQTYQISHLDQFGVRLASSGFLPWPRSPWFRGSESGRLRTQNWYIPEKVSGRLSSTSLQCSRLIMASS